MIYYFLVIYLVIVILYFEKNNNKTLNNFGLLILSIFLPVFGLIVAIIYNKDCDKNTSISYEFEEMRDKKLDDLDNFLLKSNHSNFYSELLLKNYKAARKSIINFNRLSINENSNLYTSALNCDDTEVSHMAAASLMKIKQQYENELKLNDNINELYLEEYVMKLDEYVKNNLIKGIIKDNLIIGCINHTEKYINLKSLNLNYFLSYINLLIEINKFELAKKYAYYVKDTWFYNEKSWYTLFDVLIKCKNNEELLSVIKEYKNNNFDFSNKINDFIELWEDDYAKEN